MDTLALVAPHLQSYLTINTFADYTYTYAARTGSKPWQGVECIWHRKKISGGSWLYVATDASEGPAAGPAARLLYVGSQTADRMFRGDFPSGHPLKGKNFHHAQLRNDGGADNLVEHLARGHKAHIHVIPGEVLTRLTAERREWARLAPLTRQPSDHVAYWFEQAILMESKPRFAWNVRNADANAMNVLRALGWT